MEKTYSLYILRCGNEFYYTGISSNVENRLKTHQLTDRWSIYNTKQWTKDHQPVELIFKYDGIENKIVALKMERYIKTWKQLWKKKLAEGDEFSFNLLKKCHQIKLEEYLAKSSTSSHSPQIPRPYTVHTQK